MNVSFYTSCTVITTGCHLYQDNTGITPVVDGYYSDSIDCFHVVNGVVTDISICGSVPAPTQQYYLYQNCSNTNQYVKQILPVNSLMSPGQVFTVALGGTYQECGIDYGPNGDLEIPYCNTYDNPMPHGNCWQFISVSTYPSIPAGASVITNSGNYFSTFENYVYETCTDCFNSNQISTCVTWLVTDLGTCNSGTKSIVDYVDCTESLINFELETGVAYYVCARFGSRPTFRTINACAGQVTVPATDYCNIPYNITFSDTNVCIGQTAYTYNMIIDGTPPFIIGFAGPLTNLPYDNSGYNVSFKINGQEANPFAYDPTWLYDVTDTVIPITVEWYGPGFATNGPGGAFGFSKTYSIQVEDSLFKYPQTPRVLYPLTQTISNCDDSPKNYITLQISTAYDFDEYSVACGFTTDLEVYSSLTNDGVIFTDPELTTTFVGSDGYHLIYNTYDGHLYAAIVTPLGVVGQAVDC